MDATKLQALQDRFELMLKEAGLGFWVKSEAFVPSGGVYTRDQLETYRVLMESHRGRRIVRAIEHNAKKLRIAEAKFRRNENARWKRA